MTGESVTSLNTPTWTDVSPQHIMLLGTARHGRRHLLKAEATRLGNSCDELGHSLDRTDEQLDLTHMRDEAKARTEERRLQMVRDAVWNAWSEDKMSFFRLHDALVSMAMNDSLLRSN